MADYQIIVDTCATILLISFPISLCFMIGQKLVSIFTSFVFGKEISF